MATKITKNFNIHNAKQFVESLDEQANSIYYITAGRHVEWANSTSPDVPSDSVFDTYYDLYDNLSFGKKINNADMKHMVNRHNWTTGTVYYPYSSTDTALPTRNFFVLAQEDSGYSVFKCLDNNKGAPSTQKPSVDEVDATEEIYVTTADQYQWKFMYSITTSDFDKFATSTKIPVIENANVSANAIAGAVDVIKVNDGGSRYFSVANGVVRIASVAGDSNLHEIESTAGANVIPSTTSNGSFTVERVDLLGYAKGTVESVTISAGGTGYANDEFVYFHPQAGGYPGRASVNGEYQIKTNSSGVITSIAAFPRNPDTANATTGKGIGFTSNATANVTGLSGTGANLVGVFDYGNISINANLKFTTSNNVANGVVVAANTTQLRFVDIAGDFFGDRTKVILRGQSSGALANISSIASSTSGLSSNTDFYKGSMFYITSGTGAGTAREVVEYQVTGSTRRVMLKEPSIPQIDSTSRYEISPRVAVIDTDGTGLVARAIVNTASYAINSIDINQRGSGYTFGTVKVYGNTGIIDSSNTTSAENANVELIIGPPGGHGKSAIDELYGDTIGMSVDFANNEGGHISVGNGYRQIGLLKDPLFANVTLSLTTGGSDFPVDTIVTQSAHDATIANGATGVVKSRTNQSLAVSNVYGNFVISGNSQTFIASTSNTSVQANVTGVQSNSSRAGSTTAVFNQTLTITGYTNNSDSLDLVLNEKIKQESTDATAYIESINTYANGTPSSLSLTKFQGNWLASDQTSGDDYTFTGQTSGAIGKFTGKIMPDLVDGSGEFLYYENKTETTRSTTQSERVRLLIEF